MNRKPRHIAFTRRPALLAMAAKPAVDAVAALVPGGSVFGLTCGQFSLLDLVRAIVARTGPADVRLTTWSAGGKDAEAAARMVKAGEITRIRLYADRSMPTRHPDHAASLIRLFGNDSVCWTDVHAKIALVRGGDWRVAVRSSMNLNRNPRFEQFDIDDSPDLFNHIGEWLDELDRLAPRGVRFSHSESHAAFNAALGPREVVVEEMDAETLALLEMFRG